MEWEFDLSASHLALDFANTISERVSGKGPIERLPAWRDVVRFGVQAAGVPKKEGERLLAWGKAHPDRAEALRRRIVDLREASYRAFAEIARGASPDKADLATLNEWIRRLRVDENLAWSWDDPAAPDAFLAPVVLAIRDLLTERDSHDRIKTCESDTCGWVFFDGSRNHSRRWCDMSQCGNREKVRRFYARQRE